MEERRCSVGGDMLGIQEVRECVGKSAGVNEDDEIVAREVGEERMAAGGVRGKGGDEASMDIRADLDRYFGGGR